MSPLVLAAAALALAFAVGAYHPDLVHVSGLSETLHGHGVGALPVPLGVLATLQLVQALVVGWVNVIPALGDRDRGAGLPVLFAAAGVPVDNATTGLLGWTGWVVMAVGLAIVAAFLRSGSPAAPAPLGPARAPDDSDH